MKLSKQLVSAEGTDPRCDELKAALRLVGVYSHQINNQVTVIIGSSELIHDLVPPHTPARERLEEILRSARRIGSVTQKLLSLKVPE